MARQAERSAATRETILSAAEDLFGRQGFTSTTVDQIAATSGVAKGAIYHHFPTKEAVFEAVLRHVSARLVVDLAATSAKAADVLAAVSLGVRSYFAACAEGPIGQIVLKDGPAVLGWERWRKIDQEHFGKIIPATLGAAMTSGLIRTQPVEPLARLILGAINEAAAACNASADPAATGGDYARALERLLEGLRAR